MKTGNSLTNMVGYAVLGSVAAGALLLPWDLPGAVAVPLPPDTIVLMGIVHDFKQSHPDFDVLPSGVTDHVAGNVQLALDFDQKPVAATHSSTEVSVTTDTLAGWTFDEGSGSTVTDATGVHDGTLTNGPTWEPSGKVGGALRFDGVDDFVEVPHHPDFMVDELTVSLWFNSADPVPQQGIVSKDSETYDDGGHFTVFVKDNRCRIRLQSASASYWVESAAGSVQPDTWYHVTFSFGPGGMRLYLDGVLVATNPYTGGLGTTSGGTGNEEPWTFGVNSWITDDLSSNGWIEPFRGMIDELQMYRDQLYVTELTGIAGQEIWPAWRDGAGRPIAPHVSEGGAPTAPCVVLADTAGSEAGDSDGGISSSESFAEWFREELGTNLSGARSITLTRSGGVYEYLDDAFYPIDGALLGNEGDPNNNYFTYWFKADFTYDECAGQFIEFKGGHGSWMFLDGQLVMDLGGVYANIGQHVELDRLALVHGQDYQIRFFYSQRHGAESVFRLRTNVDLATETMVTVSAPFD